jgi:hypothetical protein
VICDHLLRELFGRRILEIFLEDELRILHLKNATPAAGVRGRVEAMVLKSVPAPSRLRFFAPYCR